MVDKEYFFAVKTGYFDALHERCKFTTEENERLSSKAIDDMYDSFYLDLIGFLEKGVFTKLPIISKYETFNINDINFVTDPNENYLVFGSSYGSIQYVNNYVAEMKFCHVVMGDIFVKGFRSHKSSDYIALEFTTEGG